MTGPRRAGSRRSSLRHGAAAVLVAAVILLDALGHARAGEAHAREYLLKAAFLYNFAKFVDWPATAFAGKRAPIVICVQGDAAFAVIEAAMAGKTAGSRPIEVINTRGSTRAHVCHIVFIAAGGSTALDFAHLETHSALTVSDAPDFARKGGMVGLLTRDNKLRFEVNLAIARRAGLRISAALLRLATTVIE